MQRQNPPNEPRPAKSAGASIPDKPRDCGPTVDTWPILDTPTSESRKPRTEAKDSKGES